MEEPSPPRRQHGEEGDPPAPPSPSPPRPRPPREPPSLAERSVRGLVVGSRFFPPEAADDGWFRRPPGGDGGDDGRRGAGTPVAALEERDVRVGELLGKGGFCEVRAARLEGAGDPSSSAPCYAVKYLSPTVGARKGGRAVVRGAADLAIEARFLSLLRHDNIVRLHRVGPGSDRRRPDADGEEDGGGRRGLGYFLILDRLEDTLDRRIKSTFVPEAELLTGNRPGKRADARGPRRRWSDSLPRPRWTSSPRASSRRASSQRASSPASEWDDRRPPESLRGLLAKRLAILRGVASAIEHLHDRRILFRDLKPDNVGFHRDGARGGGETPKLYDFGLARELKSSDEVASSPGGAGGEDAVYNLTGRTGSQRYMSPEVAFSQPYNRKADVYSFGMMLYELSTLKQPFEGYNIHKHEIEVLRRGGRPPLPARDDWPEDLAPLIETCWSGDANGRPGIDGAIARLDRCIDDLASDAAGADEAPRIPRGEAPPPSPSAGPGADGSERAVRDKMRRLLSSVPAAAVLMRRPTS